MWEKVKKYVVDAVAWAEREMKGKTGAEKREAVVNKVDALIPLPWFLEWLDGLVIGWLVDKVCEKMNWLTDHNFTGGELNEEQSGKLAACLNVSVASVDADVKEKSIEERLNALYDQYGIKPEAEKTPEPDSQGEEYAEVLKEVYNANAGDLSPHFSKREFTCHCGCGAYIPCPALVEKLEKFREVCGNKATGIGSGTRCLKHNEAVGGKMPDPKKGTKGSQHLYGTAADIRKYPDMTVDEMAKKAEEVGFDGIGKYNWGIHVDVRGTKARWDDRK